MTFIVTILWHESLNGPSGKSPGLQGLSTRDPFQSDTKRNQQQKDTGAKKVTM